MDKAAQANRTNQCNPTHKPTGPGKVQHNFVHGSPHWNSIQFYNWKYGTKETFMSLVTINCVPFISPQTVKQQILY